MIVSFDPDQKIKYQNQNSKFKNQNSYGRTHRTEKEVFLVVVGTLPLWKYTSQAVLLAHSVDDQ